MRTVKYFGEHIGTANLFESSQGGTQKISSYSAPHMHANHKAHL